MVGWSRLPVGVANRRVLRQSWVLMETVSATQLQLSHVCQGHLVHDPALFPPGLSYTLVVLRDLAVDSLGLLPSWSSSCTQHQVILLSPLV